MYCITGPIIHICSKTICEEIRGCELIVELLVLKPKENKDSEEVATILAARSVSAAHTFNCSGALQGCSCSAAKMTSDIKGGDKYPVSLNTG